MSRVLGKLSARAVAALGKPGRHSDGGGRDRGAFGSRDQLLLPTRLGPWQVAIACALADPLGAGGPRICSPCNLPFEILDTGVHRWRTSPADHDSAGM